MDKKKSMDKFDKLVLETISEVLTDTLGEESVRVIYSYLERHFCPIFEIPSNLNIFSKELAKLLQTKGQRILFVEGDDGYTGITESGMASILECEIVKVLCRKLRVEFLHSGPIEFANYITELKNNCANESTIFDVVLDGSVKKN